MESGAGPGGGERFAEADWFDGQDLRGFTRDSLIGRGSTGAVYLLRNSEDQLAVVKELDVGRMGPKERQQAAQEVRFLSDLSHPNIISYYGTVFNKRRQVLEIYMEFAECGTLADMIVERQSRHDTKGVEEATVMRWTRQMISALRCVHKRKIIHRDLKPSNVFVTKDGTIKLADFGISAELSNTEQEAETVCGTPYYLSPEMVSGKPYTTATDVWSLGCILWELLTLQRPFSGSNIMQLAMEIMSKELDVSVLDARAPDVDKRLRQMVVQMLQKDPALRPTMQELHDNPFLSERLGMLYLRHANSGSATTLGATLSGSGGGSAALSRPVAAAQAGAGEKGAAGSAAVGVASSSSEREDAARAMQAGVRGWRDRTIVRFLRSFAGPEEGRAAQTSSRLDVPLPVKQAPVRPGSRGQRVIMLPPPDLLLAVSPGGTSPGAGGTPRDTPRGTPRGPICVDRSNPPSSVVPLPPAVSPSAQGSAGGLPNSSSLPSLVAAGGSLAASPQRSSRFKPLSLSLSRGSTPVASASRPPSNAGARRPLPRGTPESPLVSSRLRREPARSAPTSQSPSQSPPQKALYSTPVSPAGALGRENATLFFGLQPLAPASPAPQAQQAQPGSGPKPRPASAAHAVSSPLAVAHTAHALPRPLSTTQLPPGDSSDDSVSSGSPVQPAPPHSAPTTSRYGGVLELRPRTAQGRRGIGSLWVRDMEAQRRTSVRLRPELRAEVDLNSSPLRAPAGSAGAGAGDGGLGPQSPPKGGPKGGLATTAALLNQRGGERG